MEKDGAYRRRREILKFVVVAAVFFGVLLMGYLFVIYAEKCETKECFYSHLAYCKSASWNNDAPEATWGYAIKGEAEGKCEVEAKLLLLKKGKVEIERLEGKSMKCLLPLGVTALPGENLEYCTGQLKEEMQDLIIKRMHSYILENLGKINEEVTKPL